MRRLAVVLCVALLAGVGWWTWTTSDNNPVPPEVLACRAYLHANADRPESLKWPGGELVGGDPGDRLKTVFGRIDAKDRYGDEQRLSFKCQVQLMDDGHWEAYKVTDGD